MDALSQNGMMTSAFAQMFNDALHSYQDKYPNPQALATAMGPDAIVWGQRPLDNWLMKYFHADLGGLLSYIHLAIIIY